MSTYDGVQWQFRSFSAPAVTRDLLTTVLQPKEVFVEDHGTWNNARPDKLVFTGAVAASWAAAVGVWRALLTIGLLREPSAAAPARPSA